MRLDFSFDFPECNVQTHLNRLTANFGYTTDHRNFLGVISKVSSLRKVTD